MQNLNVGGFFRPRVSIERFKEVFEQDGGDVTLKAQLPPTYITVRIFTPVRDQHESRNTYQGFALALMDALRNVSAEQTSVSLLNCFFLIYRGSRPAIERALAAMGIGLAPVMVPSGIRDAFVDLPENLHPPPQVGVIVGLISLFLFKNVSEANYANYLQRRTQELMARCRCVLEGDEGCNVFPSMDAAQKFRNGVGQQHAIRRAVMTSLLANRNDSGPIGQASAYVCNILSWTDMTPLLMIFGTLLLTSSPVLSRPEIRSEIRSLGYAFRAVVEFDYPQYYRIMAPPGNYHLLERNKFPILIAVARSLAAARNDTLNQFAPTMDTRDQRVVDLVNLHLSQGIKMAATSAATLSIGSTVSFSPKAASFQQPKHVGVKFTTPSSFTSFSGLKAASSVNCETESSFFGKESNSVLRRSVALRSQKQQAGSFQYHLQPQASFKVAILGAGGGIGQPLALLIKMSPLVSTLHLYDIANVKGVAADLSHCNTPSQVVDFTGASELANSLKGVDVVVIPAGVPRKPGMTRDDLFNINANIVKGLVEAVADNCPEAFIHIISNPVNSTVPIAAEVLKQKGVYDPKKLFGVTTLDVVRANTFVAQKKNLKLIDVDVPVIGGHAGITILPLLSKTRPSVSFSDEEVQELTVRIQNAGTEVVEAKAGAGSATLSMAYAAARFVESSLRALDGDGDVYECSYVQSDLTGLPFFASRVKLGKKGVEALIPSDLQDLTEYEQKALEALKPELKTSIEKGIMFAQKQAVAA